MGEGYYISRLKYYDKNKIFIIIKIVLYLKKKTVHCTDTCTDAGHYSLAYKSS